MARWYDEEGNLVENGKLMIDVTKPARPQMAGPRIDVTKAPDPVVRGLMIDGRQPGDFRNYEQATNRSPGGFTERIAIPSQKDGRSFGMERIVATDKRLTDMGAGGLQIIQPGTGRSDRLIQNDAAGISGDGNIVLSQGAISELGKRKLADEQAVRALEDSRKAGGPAKTIMVDLKSVLQKQADQGFVAPGTDARNRDIMRGTEERQADIMLRRSRPRDLMTRRNTADQIMTQADASIMTARETPQVMTADGVMAGYEPKTRSIVSDSSGARAIAASRTKDISLDSETDKTIMDETAKLEMRKSGKLSGDYALFYSGMAKTNPQMAEEYKKAIIGEWSDLDDQQLSRYKEHGVKRGLYKPPASVGGAAAKGTKKTLGGVQAR